MATKLAEATFDARVVKETSMSPRPVADYGVVRNHVTLYAGHDAAHFCVEWTSPDDDSIYADIGIVCEYPRKVVDYDGVFSVPLEIGRFLQAQGFDLSELYDSHPELRPKDRPVMEPTTE